MAKDFATALQLGNIPLINLRYDFIRWRRWIKSGELSKHLAQHGLKKPIRTPLLIWGGMPEDLLTMILQRTILGAESYIPAAVWFELGKTGRLTPELNKQIRDPFSIPPKRQGTAQRYYNAVPALLDGGYSLDQKNSALWDDIRGFYKTVRNKVLHGYQIGAGAARAEALQPIFDMFFEVHKWVDSWHDPNIGWSRSNPSKTITAT